LICLSFDTDHLDDERMREFVAEVPVPGAGTFFCTQPYEALDPKVHELCPHPTLEEGMDWDAELDRFRADFPDARGVRTHSCINSHLISIQFQRRGYQWVSMRDEPGRAGIVPYRESWGVWHLPIYYMDNMDFSAGDYWDDGAGEPFDKGLLERATGEEGLYVFDFHPIHLMLNSTSSEAYFERRDDFKTGKPIEELRCGGYGARSFYEELLSLMEGAGIDSTAMSDAVQGLSEAS